MGAGASSPRLSTSIQEPSGSVVSVNSRCGSVCSSRCAASSQLLTLNVSTPRRLRTGFSASQGSGRECTIKANKLPFMKSPPHPKSHAFVLIARCEHQGERHRHLETGGNSAPPCARATAARAASRYSGDLVYTTDAIESPSGKDPDTSKVISEEEISRWEWKPLCAGFCGPALCGSSLNPVPAVTDWKGDLGVGWKWGGVKINFVERRKRS